MSEVNDLIIDEQEMKATAEIAKSIVQYLENHINDLLNKDSDAFTRYMAYTRLYFLMKHLDGTEKLFKQILKFGNDLNNDFFDCKERKENGWSDHDCFSSNPFLTTLKEKKDDCIEQERREKLNQLFRSIFESIKN